MEKNVKKKGRLKMALFTFSGGVHPADGKEFAKNSPITEYLPKGDVVLPLGQHIGAPARSLCFIRAFSSSHAITCGGS